jgi:hypothetical protein
MAKLTVTFRNSAKAPKISISKDNIGGKIQVVVKNPNATAGSFGSWSILR